MDSMYLAGLVDSLPSYPFLDAAAAPVVTSPDGLAQRKALAAQVVTYLANFAKTSDPNGDGRNVATAWPRYAGPADRQTIELTLPAIKMSSTRFEQVHNCGTVWPPIY
jgi:para-nitrobenzyl esterase